MSVFFITSICAPYDERINRTRFSHHPMEAYKFYQTLDGKTPAIFFYFIANFFSKKKKKLIVLLETPSILSKL